MKLSKIILFCITYCISYGLPVTDRESAIQNIKNRNGDVYILMYPNNGNTGKDGKHGVWRFVRGDDYPDDTKYKRSYLTPADDPTLRILINAAIKAYLLNVAL